MRRTYKRKVVSKKEEGRRSFLPNSLLLIPYTFFLLLSFAHSSSVFTDALKRHVSLKVYPPQRIISLAPNITEILYAIQADKQLIGVTDVCKYPPEAQKKEIVGGFINPNLEKIVSLNPDIVIVTADSNQKKVFDQLVQLKIPVYVIDPENMSSTLTTIFQLGDLTGHLTKAKEIVNSLKQRIDAVKMKVKNSSRPKVLFLWSEDPLITAGKNTFTDDLINIAGGTNIARDSKIKYPKFSTEEILRRKPEIIITSAMETQKPRSNLLERWLSWTDIPAVKNKRIYAINIELVARPAPSIVDGLEELARLIHPEIFNK